MTVNLYGTTSQLSISVNTLGMVGVSTTADIGQCGAEMRRRRRRVGMRELKQMVSIDDTIHNRLWFPSGGSAEPEEVGPG